MSILTFFKRNKSKDSSRSGVQDRGILIFENTSEVIRAETVLKKEGWEIRVMGPPPEIRTGCDLIIEFPLIEELNILRTLDAAGAPAIGRQAQPQRASPG